MPDNFETKREQKPDTSALPSSFPYPAALMARGNQQDKFWNFNVACMALPDALQTALFNCFNYLENSNQVDIAYLESCWQLLSTQPMTNVEKLGSGLSDLKGAGLLDGPEAEYYQKLLLRYINNAHKLGFGIRRLKEAGILTPLFEGYLEKHADSAGLMGSAFFHLKKAGLEGPHFQPYIDLLLDFPLQASNLALCLKLLKEIRLLENDANRNRELLRQHTAFADRLRMGLTFLKSFSYESRLHAAMRTKRHQEYWELMVRHKEHADKIGMGLNFLQGEALLEEPYEEMNRAFILAAPEYADKLALGLCCLHKYSLLVGENGAKNRIALQREAAHADYLDQALSALWEHGLMTAASAQQQWESLHPKAAHGDKLATGIRHLGEEKLLTPEIWEFLLNDAEHADKLSAGLKFLNDAGFSQGWQGREKRQLLSKYAAQADFLGEAIKNLKEVGLLTEEDNSVLAELLQSSQIINLSEGLRHVKNAGLLKAGKADFYWQLLRESSHPSQLGWALKCLAEAHIQPDEEILRFLSTHAQYADSLYKGIILLKQMGSNRYSFNDLLPLIPHLEQMYRFSLNRPGSIPAQEGLERLFAAVRQKINREPALTAVLLAQHSRSSKTPLPVSLVGVIATFFTGPVVTPGQILKAERLFNKENQSKQGIVPHGKQAC